MDPTDRNRQAACPSLTRRSTSFSISQPRNQATSSHVPRRVSLALLSCVFYQTDRLDHYCPTATGTAISVPFSLLRPDSVLACSAGRPSVNALQQIHRNYPPFLVPPSAKLPRYAITDVTHLCAADTVRSRTGSAPQWYLLWFCNAQITREIA